jgi:hypothetical protein
MVFLKHLGSLQKVYLLDLLYTILDGQLKEISPRHIFKGIFTPPISTTERYPQQKSHKILTHKETDSVCRYLNV